MSGLMEEKNSSHRAVGRLWQGESPEEVALLSLPGDGHGALLEDKPWDSPASLSWTPGFSTRGLQELKTFSAKSGHSGRTGAAILREPNPRDAWPTEKAWLEGHYVP